MLLSPYWNTTNVQMSPPAMSTPSQEGVSHLSRNEYVILKITQVLPLSYLNMSALFQMGPTFPSRLLWERSKAWLKVVRWSEALQIFPHFTSLTADMTAHTVREMGGRVNQWSVSGCVIIILNILETIALNRMKPMVTILVKPMHLFPLKQGIDKESSVEPFAKTRPTTSRKLQDCHYSCRGHALLIFTYWCWMRQWLHNNKVLLFASNLGRKMHSTKFLTNKQRQLLTALNIFFVIPVVYPYLFYIIISILFDPSISHAFRIIHQFENKFSNVPR